MATYTPRQQNWMWFYDDAAEPTNAYAAETVDNTHIITPKIPLYTNKLRLRVCIRETGGKADNSVTIAVQYSTDDSSFTAFAAGNHWNYADGQAVEGNTTTTFKLSDTTTHNEYCESGTNVVAIGASTANELDICIQATANATHNTRYYFQIIGDGTAIPANTGEAHPQLVLVKGSGATIRATSTPVFSIGKFVRQYVSGAIAAVSTMVGRISARRLISPLAIGPSGVPTTLAAHGDWPDYASVPQMDHYWDINNSSVDTPAAGKTERDGTWLAAITYGNDWSGRATQAAEPDAANFVYAAADPDYCNLGATWTWFHEFHVGALTTNNYPTYVLTGGAPYSGYHFRVSSAGDFVVTTLVSDASDSVTAAGLFTAGEDCQLVVTLGGGNCTIYKNGNQILQQALTAPGDAGANIAYFFGPYDSGWKLYSCGVLKGTALTLTQVQNRYATWEDCGGGVYKRHPDSPETFSSTPNTGVIAAISLAAAGVVQAVGAVIAAASSVIAAPSVRRPLAAVVRATSAVVAASGIRRVIRATVAAASNIVAANGIRRPLAAVANATSSAVGSVAVRRSIAAVISAASGVVAGLRIVGSAVIWAISATISASSSAVAALNLRRVLSITITATTGVVAATARRFFLTAVIPAVSSAIAATGIRRSLSAVVSAASNAGAALNIRLLISMVVSAVSGVGAAIAIIGGPGAAAGRHLIGFLDRKVRKPLYEFLHIE